MAPEDVSELLRVHDIVMDEQGAASKDEQRKRLFEMDSHLVKVL